MEESPRPKQQQNYRSLASNNWRMPSDSPRADPQPRSQARNTAPESVPGTRLYVGNLLYTAQSKDVEQLFIDNGFVVAKITMSVDPFTGRNPSYCFVDLESPEEATRAMDELNGKDVLGRGVRVNPGVPKKSDGSPQVQRTRNFEGGWGRGGDRGSPNEGFKPSSDRWGNNGPQSPSQNQEQGKRIYVGGLPQIESQSAVESEMQNIFKDFGVQTVSKLISPHPSKAEEPGNHYYLFIDMATSDDVSAAIQQLNGTEAPWGGELKVSRAKESRERRPPRDGQQGGERQPLGNAWRRGA